MRKNTSNAYLQTFSAKRLKPRSHRARRVASTRVDATTFDLLASNVGPMYIHPAVNYVIVSYVIVNDVIEHRCRLVMESDSDTDILAIYCY